MTTGTDSGLARRIINGHAVFACCQIGKADIAHASRNRAGLLDDAALKQGHGYIERARGSHADIYAPDARNSCRGNRLRGSLAFHRNAGDRLASGGRIRIGDDQRIAAAASSVNTA